jgi:hypothetical protein
MPLPKIPAQGDMARLEQLGSGLKQTNGTSGPVIQRTPAGRPQGSGGGQAPKQQAAVDPAHLAFADRVAQAEATRQFWQQWVQAYPGPNSEYYAAQADIEAQQVHEEFFTATPNFE